MARSTPEISNASMADIAFLLLTFILVTTTIEANRGLILQLPPRSEIPTREFEVHERNIFKVQVNSSDALLVEGQPMTEVTGLREMVKRFILNYGADRESSVSPEEAIVSFKTDRGTSHKRFVEILDILQEAYYDIYAERAGVSNRKWRELTGDLANAANRGIYDKARGLRPDGSIEIPMQLSISETARVGQD